MTLRRPRGVLAAAATCAALALTGAPAAEAVPSVTFKCTPAPQDCSGWFRSNVAIDWTWLPSDATVLAGCQDKTYTADTPGTNDFCKVSDGSAETTVQLKITARHRAARGHRRLPGSRRRCQRLVQPRRPGELPGHGREPPASPHAPRRPTAGPTPPRRPSRGSAPTRPGIPAARSGTASSTTRAGRRSLGVRPERTPDFFGWYTRPVRLDVFGTDALSGLAECPSIVYSGPDGLAARASAACRDRAANTSTQCVRPVLRRHRPAGSRVSRFRPGDRRIDVSWRRAPDAVSIEVVRSPGRASAAESVVYSGPGRKFRDRKVSNGKRYTYRVRLADAAGNATCEVRLGRGGAEPRLTRRSGRLARPAGGRRSGGRRCATPATTTCRSTATAARSSARGRARPRYRLKRSWMYGGHRRHLSKGTYIWYVWPGYGTRSERRFGRRIGHRILRIR